MKNAEFITEIKEIVYNTNDAGESFSSVSLNPTFAWMKFILTDDMPNANKQRVPKEEFANLIKTGVFAPVKKAVGLIEEDHDNALPLGVITHLKENENKAEGIAALWKRERETDINQLKEMFAAGNLPQLSWELMYEDSNVDENGVESLIGVSLRAVTVVGMPAYEGRTPIFAMASKNSNSEELTVEELEALKAKVTELETTLAAKDSELSSKVSELEGLSSELNELRQYKKTIEDEKAAIEKFSAIKKKFADAGLEKTDEYFSEKKDFLLGLPEDALDFMIQEMVAFSSKTSESSTKSKMEIPPLQDNDLGVEEDPKKLAEALRLRLHKK